MTPVASAFHYFQRLLVEKSGISSSQRYVDSEALKFKASGRRPGWLNLLDVGLDHSGLLPP